MIQWLSKQYCLLQKILKLANTHRHIHTDTQRHTKPFWYDLSYHSLRNNSPLCYISPKPPIIYNKACKSLSESEMLSFYLGRRHKGKAEKVEIKRETQHVASWGYTIEAEYILQKNYF